MEFLKEVFGTEPLTYEQLAEKLKGNEGIKLGNLAGGAYVGRDKFATLETERNGLREQLNTANAKLEGYDPEWKAKAEQAETAASGKIAAMQFDFALESALTSAKARNPKAVKALLNVDGLKLSDGQIVGLNEQLEAIQKDNDFLFYSDTPAPTITKPGSPPPTKGTEKEYMDDYYKGNPFYGKK